MPRVQKSPFYAIIRALCFGLISLSVMASSVAVQAAPLSANIPRSPQKLQELKAMLAIIGADGNVSVYDANGKNPIRVTTDAQAGQRVYQWPTWATDGRLAFFGASADPVDLYSLRMFVTDPSAPNLSVTSAYSSADETFTYAYWSPGDCAAQSAATSAAGGCRELALLFTPADQSGLSVRLIRDEGDRFSNRIIGQSSPFYYSFAPDGTKMLWFQNGSQLEVYDVAADKVINNLSDTPGKFQAPMWSPIDDRLLFGTTSADPAQTDLVIAQGTDRRVLLRGLDGPISFAWSPDAALIASVAGYDKVQITDVKTGKSVASGTQGNVIAHFWSPQSDRVAYLVVNRDTAGSQARLRANGHTPAEQATGGLTWYVLDVKTGNDAPIVTFAPTRDMVYLLNFFDQFARSHSLWSPDGRYLTYGAVDLLGKQNVMIVDTQQISNPIKVGAGSVGIWSWQ